MKSVPRIVIDTREQKPYAFGKLDTVVATLRAGDYSLEGYENRVAVERKSKEDAYGCVGTGRKRFEKHVEKLGALDRAAIVIESSHEGFWTPPEYSKVRPASAVGSYTAWGVKYGITIMYADNRRLARDWVVRFLLAYYKYFGEGAA